MFTVYYTHNQSRFQTLQYGIHGNSIKQNECHREDNQDYEIWYRDRWIDRLREDIPIHKFAPSLLRILYRL